MSHQPEPADLKILLIGQTNTYVIELILQKMQLHRFLSHTCHPDQGGATDVRPSTWPY